MTSGDPETCPQCRTPLEGDGVCLACILGEALEADSASTYESGRDTEKADATPPSDSGFGQFTPLAAGTFGKYCLRRKIGSGGMGVIWEAEDFVVHRLVALKMIRGFTFATDAEKLRFRTETMAAAQLDHPGIVPIYEVSEAEGQPFFTMKLLQGGSLQTRLREGALKAAEAVRIMEKLARAVQHAHERGVLHRDLKPGNVLFDQGGEPYLTDFGLAKLLDKAHGLTLSNTHVGTPHYMSPEQAGGGARDVTTASDVWGLGVMLYQMLAGRLPFTGSTTAEIFHRITHAEPAALPSTTTDTDLETLCLRCLDKEPSRRLTSAGELADELGRWLRGEPILSRRVSGQERVLRWMRRHPWHVAALSALVLSLVSGTIVSLTLWQTAEKNRRIAEANSEKAIGHAEAERRTGYVSTIASALAARERYDFSRATQLLESTPEDLRGLEWRLLTHLCRGDQLSLFHLPPGEIAEALAPGPDGESLALVSQKGGLHLRTWSGETLHQPRQLPPLPGPPDPGKLNPRDFHSLHYAPGGRHFTCAFRNTIRVFDSETLEVVMRRDGIVQPQSAWLDDRRLLYGHDISTAGVRGSGAWIFDVESGSTQPLPSKWTAPLAVSDDRRTVALTGGQRFQVALFRAADLTGPHPLRDAVPLAHWRPRTSGHGNVLALSPDGRYLAALCGPLDAPAHTVEVAEPATGRSFMALGFRETMTGLAFHPSQPLLALSSADAVVRMFSFLQPVPSGPPTYDDDCPPVIRQPIDGNGEHSPPRRLLTRSALDGRAAYLLGHEGRGTGVLFSPRGDSLVSTAADGTVRRWSSKTPTPPTRLPNAHLYKLELHPAASPDGSRLLYSDRFDWVHYWQEDQGYTPLIQGHMPLAVLPHGQLATMERESSDIFLWQEDSQTIRAIDRIPGPGYIQGFTGLLSGLVSPDGRHLVGITPGQVFVVDLASRTCTATGDQGWETGPARGWDIAISPDGHSIAATGLGHRTRIFDLLDLSQPSPRIGTFRNYDSTLAFHPDGSRLYCGNEDGRVRVFATDDWSEIPDESWQAHRGAITAMAMSHDSRLLATAGGTALKLWLVKNPLAPAPVEMLAFSTYTPAAWLHFGRDPSGEDRSLMLCPPFGPLEIWHGPRAPHSPATAVGVSSLKVLRPDF